jgi:putative multiple sugar transport system substrate-binding protein
MNKGKQGKTARRFGAKRWISCGLALVMATGMAAIPGCTAERARVGITMPDKFIDRWVRDGELLETMLKEQGYAVDIKNADNSVEAQAAQIYQFLSDGCDVIVVTAVDGAGLTEPLAAAKAAGVEVIAYDRLLMNTDAVSYYVTFNNYGVGQAQGQFIKDTLAQKEDYAQTDSVYNLELFTGPATDNNVRFFFNGAKDILNPLMDEGKVVVPSQNTAMEVCGIAGWSEENAKIRMDDLIARIGYAPKNGTALDAVLCSNDALAQGVIEALTDAGFTPDNFPIITGQDAEIESIQYIIDGYQSMTVFKDTRLTAEAAVNIINQIVDGQKVETDPGSYDNGEINVPTVTCELSVITKENYQSLIDGGYYTEEQLFPNAE